MPRPQLIERFDQWMYRVNTPYRRSLDAATQQHLTRSRVRQTAHGPIEYALSAGTDPTVFVSHTAMGGYDQGLALQPRFAPQRVLAVSRAGYLRTPLASGPTPAAMADTYAALLDALGIGSVVMVGLSAGGMSAVMFALRYPQRVRGLILGAAVTQALPTFVTRVLAPIGLSINSDFVNWALGRLNRLTIPLRSQDETTRGILQGFADVNPSSARWPGYEQDVRHLATFHAPLAELTVPTLLIHGTLDVLVPLRHAQHAAEVIPDADLLVLPGGAHDSPIQYAQTVTPAVQAFMARLG